MRERRDDVADHHQPVVRRDGGDQVAGDEQHHQHGEHWFAFETRHGGRQEQRPDNDGERVAGDEPACRGLADLEVGGHFGQQAHNDELGKSDPEPAEGECYQANGHGGAPSKTVRKDLRSVSY